MSKLLPLAVCLLSCTSMGCQSSVEDTSDRAKNDQHTTDDTAKVVRHRVSNAPIRLTDWALLGLQGRVKSITTHHCRIQTTPAGSNKLCKGKTTIFFHSNGYQSEEWFWEDFGMDGHPETLREKRVYFYDSENRCTKIRYYFGDDKRTMTYAIRHDPAGNEIQELFEKDSSLTTRYIQEYDTAGRKTKMTGYTMGDSARTFITETFKYDATGNLIEERSESQTAGILQHLHRYIYDKEKKMIKKTTTSTYNNDRYLTTTQYTYDTAGRVVQEMTQHQDWRPRKTEVTWDAIGNWLLRTEPESGNSILTVERSIEYY